jgi:uncharacterized protein (TIGR02117 family)
MEKIKRSARWSGRFLYRAFEVITLLLACWITCAILLPNIRVNTFNPASVTSVEIYVRSNGVHTDFVLPVHNEYYAWDTFISPGMCNADSTYNYVALGWGDKGFFLNTPTWDDLTFSTAFVAASGIGESAMHVDYVKDTPKIGERVKLLRITSMQYALLIDYIRNSFILANNKVMLIDHAGYGKRDKFFEANGRYSLFMTCNEWTGDGMEAAGMPVGIWTPLEFGIMKE